MAAVISPVRAQVLYSQTFDYAATTSTNAASVGWHGYIGSTAYDVTVGRAVVSGQESVKIYGNYGSPQATKGYMALDNFTATADTYITYVSGLSLAGATTLSWQMSVNSVSNIVQTMVQVGGIWYVSNATYSLAASYSTSNLDTNMASASTCTFDLTTATQWTQLTITPGTGYVLASSPSTLDLTTNTITGVGFFASIQGYKTVNFDSIAVSIVPEPSAFTLLTLGLFGVAALRRRTIGTMV